MLVHHRNSTALSPIAIGTADTFPKVPRGETAAAGAAEPPAGPNKAWDYRGGGRNGERALFLSWRMLVEEHLRERGVAIQMAYNEVR